MGDRIRTPDQRLRVFVSSTLGELAEERRAARAAIEQLRLAPVMFELGARPHPPRALYRAYLDQSDVFVGVYWQRYGWVAPDMDISGLEDEFRLSAGLPRLMYLKRPAPDMEPRLREMLGRLEAEGSVSYRSFSDAQELQRLLADDLAIMLAERFDAAGATAPQTAVPAVPQPATRLVGRDKDVDQIAALFTQAGHRLVTLTGVGGIGKTRLALATLATSRATWTNGAWFVDLTSTSQPEGVLDVIAAACGVVAEGRETPLDALARRLSGGPALLVLDNFEHVTAAAPMVAELLQRCDQLSVLATSRAVLHLRGEQEWPVHPLAVPTDVADLQQLDEAPAVALFVERAQEARPSFTLTADNAAAVLELCRRLDGLPLALELAAPRIRLLTPAQILTHLDTRLDLAGSYADLPARQRTLGAALDWSYELLPAASQRLLARLAALTGPFTFDTVEKVCGWDETDVVEALSTLVDHSLINATERTDGEPGFRMLETVRAYAAQHLERSGEYDAAFEHLRDYLTEVFSSTAPRLHTADQPLALRRLDAEVGNFMAVFDWVADRGGSFGHLLTTMPDTWVFWQVRGYFRRMPEMLPRIEGSPALASMTDRDWSALQFAHAGNLFSAGRYAEVVEFLPPRLDGIASAYGPAEAGLMQVVVAISRPYEDHELAHRELEDALTKLRGPETRIGLAYGLAHYGGLLLDEGDVEGARVAHEEALAIGAEVGDVNIQAEATVQLGHNAVATGDFDEARQRITTAAEMYRGINHQEGMGFCLGALAGLAIAEGDPERGAVLLGAATGLREEIGLSAWPLVAELERRYEATAREQLGSDAFAAAFARGKMTDQPERTAWGYASLRP